jgi:ketosteroid isomerase-like protein
MEQSWRLTFCATGFLLLGACGAHTSDSAAPHNESEAESQIYDAVMAIKQDIETSNIAGLQKAHLNSAKFSKFGPRKFERQDVEAANQSEAAFFSSISEASYEVNELKIDVFGDVGIATYYPEVSFLKNETRMEASGRQTLVFLNTDAGWKLIHEHGTAR